MTGGINHLTEIVNRIVEQNRKQAEKPRLPLSNVKSLVDFLSEMSGAKAIVKDPTAVEGYITAILGPALGLQNKLVKEAGKSVFKVMPTEGWTGLKGSVAQEGLGPFLKKFLPFGAIGAGFTSSGVEASEAEKFKSLAPFLKNITQKPPGSKNLTEEDYRILKAMNESNSNE